MLLKQDVMGSKSTIVPPTGFEPVIFWMRTRCPKPLDDGGLYAYFTLKLRF